MSDSSTISIDIKRGDDVSTKHYSIDGIAYFKSTESSLRVIAYLVIGLPILAGLALTVLMKNPVALVLGVVVAGVLWWILRDPHSIEIGTTTTIDQLKTSDSQTIENSFLEYIKDPITVQGSVDTRFHSYDYRYHFLPRNIVSVERTHNKPGLVRKLAFAILGLYVLGTPTAMLYMSLTNRYGPNILLSILGFIIAVVIMVVSYYFLFSTSEVMEIDLQGGETVEFVMSPTDIERVEQEFVR